MQDLVEKKLLSIFEDSLVMIQLESVDGAC